MCLSILNRIKQCEESAITAIHTNKQTNQQMLIIYRFSYCCVKISTTEHCVCLNCENPEMRIKVIAWTATLQLLGQYAVIFFNIVRSFLPSFNRTESIDMKQNTHIEKNAGISVVCQWWCMTTSSHSHFHSLLFPNFQLIFRISQLAYFQFIHPHTLCRMAYANRWITFWSNSILIFM